MNVLKIVLGVRKCLMFSTCITIMAPNAAYSNECKNSSCFEIKAQYMASIDDICNADKEGNKVSIFENSKLAEETFLQSFVECSTAGAFDDDFDYASPIALGALIQSSMRNYKRAFQKGKNSEIPDSAIEDIAIGQLKRIDRSCERRGFSE